MKICLLTMGVYPVPATDGGAVETLAELMAEDYLNGDYPCSLDIISVYSEKAAQQAKKYPGVNFHYIKYAPLSETLYSFAKRLCTKVFNFAPVRLKPFFAKALQIIRRENYDVVVCENCLYYVQPLKKYTNSRVVFHLHNDPAPISYHKPHTLLRNCDKMIAVSEYVARNVREAKECNYPVVTVKNVIDTARFAPDSAKTAQARDIRTSLGFDENDTVCLFAGRLVADKGIDLLIEAMSLIDDPHIKLMVVGGSAFADSQKTEFEQQLLDATQRLGGRVGFTGYVAYKDIADYYSACDIAVFPSQCPEAAGLVLLEAQSAGKPVILSDGGGMPEYTCPEASVIVPLGDNYAKRLADAICHVAADRELSRTMGKAGMEYAAQYDKEGYFGRILSAIE